MQILYYGDSTIPVFSPVSQMDIASLSLALSLALSLSLCNLLSNREICRSCIMEIVPFLCFHHFMDVHSLSLLLSLCSHSMQSPIDREICRSHIMAILLFLCFHHFMDGHSLSLSSSLSTPPSLFLYVISSVGKYADLVLWR